MDMLFWGDGEDLWTAKFSEVVPNYRCNIGVDPDDEKVWQKGVYTTTTRRGAGVATAARCSSLAVASLAAPARRSSTHPKLTINLRLTQFTMWQ